jgi:hypothetical protein
MGVFLRYLFHLSLGRVGAKRKASKEIVNERKRKNKKEIENRSK